MKKRIVHLGDSIVAWNQNSPYQIFAIPGHTSLDMYWTLQNYPDLSGELVIFSLGVNDILYHYPKEKSFETIQILLQILKKRFHHILITSLLPTDSTVENVSIQEYNLFLKKQGFPFLDMYSHFLDEKKERIAPQYTTDGTHLSHTGYARFNFWINEYVANLFPLPYEPLT